MQEVPDLLKTKLPLLPQPSWLGHPFQWHSWHTTAMSKHNVTLEFLIHANIKHFGTYDHKKIKFLVVSPVKLSNENQHLTLTSVPVIH